MTLTAPGSVGVERWRKAGLDRRVAARLAATEYQRFLDQLRDLAPADWSRPTECPGWDVRAMVGHVLGEVEMLASPRAGVRQNRAAARAGGGIDALTAVQVRQNAGLTTGEVVERFARTAPRAARTRRFLSRVGRLPFPQPQVSDGRTEHWTVGYLADVILTRDPWMHRVDIARATGRELVLTPDHDGVLVAAVVAEWASRHGRPYRLELTGPAGGTWSSGAGEELSLDAVEFCRLVSGRGHGEGLLATPVPF